MPARIPTQRAKLARITCRIDRATSKTETPIGGTWIVTAHILEVLATIADGADDLKAATDYIVSQTKCGPLLVYGISSGALRAALFAERHPERVKRLALDAFVWTGKDSPTMSVSEPSGR